LYCQLTTTAIQIGIPGNASLSIHPFPSYHTHPKRHLFSAFEEAKAKRAKFGQRKHHFQQAQHNHENAGSKTQEVVVGI
jgi:hypothetical protein